MMLMPTLQTQTDTFENSVDPVFRDLLLFAILFFTNDWPPIYKDGCDQN